MKAESGNVAVVSEATMKGQPLLLGAAGSIGPRVLDDCILVRIAGPSESKPKGGSVLLRFDFNCFAIIVNDS
jgi:hypothetical protein